MENCIDIGLTEAMFRKELNRKYWLGKRPYDGKKWVYTTSGIVINNRNMKKIAFDLYQLYVTQWNNIEGDLSRCLSEHTHQLGTAKVIEDFDRFILKDHNDNNDCWILEICFFKNFERYKAGLSCCLKPLSTIKNIRNVVLHWSDNGHLKFKNWCKTILGFKYD